MFILHDGPADGAAKLIVVKWGLWLVGCVEEITCVQSVVAEILERSTVELVRSTPGHDVDYAPPFRPYSGSKFESTRISLTASIGKTADGVANTPPWLMAGSLRYPSFMSVPSSR